MSTARRIMTVLAVLIAPACEDAEAGDVLEPEDVVVLEENEAQPIGQPMHLAIRDDGYIGLVDRLNPGVTIFTEAGVRSSHLGERGEGPGELENAYVSFFVPGGRIGVAGAGSEVGIFLFDIEGEAYLETIPMSTAPSWVSPGDGHVLLGALDYARGASVVEMDLSTWEQRWFGPIPETYTEGGPTGGIFPAVFPVSRGSEGYLVGFEPLGHLVRLANGSDEGVAVEVPSVRRRGTPSDLTDRIDDAIRRSYPEVFAQTSVLSFMTALDDGRVLLIHEDLRADGPPTTVESAHLTVVDLDDEMVCVDVPVPLPDATRPVFAWHDGRLAVLQQEIGEAGGAPAILRWYSVHVDRCAWEVLN